MKRKKAPPVFKEYTMGQLILLPTNLEELIAPNHLVRVVNTFVEQMDLVPLLAKYKGGGTSSYHPKMMLKVFIYAYTQQIFSSRRIAKALRETIPFMWLSGNNRPDFRTINRFRGELLKGIIEEVFLAVLSLLIEGGYVNLEDYFVDGTKVEANANRYTYVWAKSTQRYQKQLAKKVATLFEEIERVNAEENARYGDRDLEEVGEDGPIDPHKLEQRVAELNTHLQVEAQAPLPAEPEPPAEAELRRSEILESKLQEVQQALVENPDNKPLKKAAKLLEKDYLPRMRKYEDQERKLAGRNSYSRTDPEATFMRLKDDPLGHGQLKAAYNVQLGTENQFVVGFSLHQEAGDANCLVPHLEGVKRGLGRLPQKANGDAAYGSEENYAYLEREQVGNYLKFGGFDREQKKRYQPDPFKAENMPYDPERDQFTCLHGKRLRYRWTEHRITKNGYATERRVYECESCQDCPLREKCTRAAGNRQVRVSFQLWTHRQQARENLLSAAGQRLRSQRGVDVESVFGRVKEDWGFRRFLLRGLAKVTVEWGLLSMAHNLAKVWSVENEPRLALC
jgi:transposase